MSQSSEEGVDLIASDDDSASAGGASSGSGAVCVGDVIEGNTRPLAIYILFDQSGSMITEVDNGVSRLDAVRDATASFLGSTESTGLSVGIGYFGQQPLGETSCDAADYSTPDVDFGELPDQVSALLTSLNAREPVGETPTGPAIDGACGYVGEWSDLHPTFERAILLVTDGVPEAPVTAQVADCDPTLDDAVQSARDCLATGVQTYVLGVGPSLENLDSIAQAGNTDQAFLVEGKDVAAHVLDALSTIRDLALPCDFTIPKSPEGSTVDFQEFNVLYTSADGATDSVGYAEEAAACDDELGGWFLDDPDDPTEIRLCPATCELVSAGGGRFAFEFGCTRRPIRGAR